MISNEVKEMDAYKFEQEDKIKNPVYDNNFIFGNLNQGWFVDKESIYENVCFKIIPALEYTHNGVTCTERH